MSLQRVLFAVVVTWWMVPSVKAAEMAASTMEDQEAVEVTVYNGNLGLVKDVRKLALPEGEGELHFMDIAASIMPETVHVASLNHPEALGVLEQNYEYDLMNPQKLLDKYVGKEITLIDRNEFQDRQDVVKAILLSNNQGPVYNIGDQIYLGHPGLPVLPKLPEDLIARPTLTWLYRNQSRDAHRVEVSYLTNHITWKADYVFALNAEDTGGDLAGWVTVTNASGAVYRHAKLKLVAGNVHRAEDAREGDMSRMTMAISGMAKAAPQFQEQGLFEYHLYDLQRPSTVKNNETKQISLLEAEGVGVKKELLVYGVATYYTRQYREENPKQPVHVHVSFKNAKGNQLGMPLPGGIVRVYKKDRGGSLQFVGEDRIEHTPKDEEVRLKIGEVFDVVATRRQTDFRQLTTRLYESAWEITLNNHKDEDVTVGVIEPVPGTWEVVQASHDHKKLDAFTIRFDVPVPKQQEVKVTYRVRVGI